MVQSQIKDSEILPSLAKNRKGSCFLVIVVVIVMVNQGSQAPRAAPFLIPYFKLLESSASLFFVLKLRPVRPGVSDGAGRKLAKRRRPFALINFRKRRLWI